MEKKSTREELDEVRLEKEKLRLALEKRELEQSGRIIYKSEDKTELEFQRYKQDCRKRALDLAHGERNYVATANPLERQVPTHNPETIIKSADKYYNWLISIPE